MKPFLRQVLAGVPNVRVTFNQLYNPTDPYPAFWSLADLEAWCTANNCTYTFDETTKTYVFNLKIS